MNDQVLQRLAQTLEERKQADAGESYVASLYKGGDDAILKKVGEESTEFILAAKDLGTGQQEGSALASEGANKGANERPNDLTGHLVKETADLWFHTMVMLAHKNIDVSAVLDELDRRFGRSGLTEKAERNIKEG